MTWWQPVIVLVIGSILALICFIVGSYIMFKAKSTPGSGQGFLAEPKGDVFSIPDDMLQQDVRGSGEPSKDEVKILERTNRFLKALGGER